MIRHRGDEYLLVPVHILKLGETNLGTWNKNGFEDIVAEFEPQFEKAKELSRAVRNIFFQLIRDGAISAGTFRDNGIMMR